MGMDGAVGSGSARMSVRPRPQRVSSAHPYIQPGTRVKVLRCIRHIHYNSPLPDQILVVTSSEYREFGEVPIAFDGDVWNIDEGYVIGLNGQELRYEVE